jgi:hypothetical protein
MTDEGIGVWNNPSYNEQPQGQSPSPGHDHCTNFAQAMCIVPSAVGTVLAGWVLQSTISNGERTDTLWSNAVSGGTGGTLYLSIVTIKETPPAYLTTSVGNHKIVSMAMCLG